MSRALAKRPLKGRNVLGGALNKTLAGMLDELEHEIKKALEGHA